MKTGKQKDVRKFKKNIHKLDKRIRRLVRKTLQLPKYKKDKDENQ